MHWKLAGRRLCFCVQVCTPLVVESAELVGFLLSKRAGLINLDSGLLGCDCVFAFLYVATPTTRAQRGCVPVLLKEAGARGAVALCRRPAGRYLRGPLYWPASQRDRRY